MIENSKMKKNQKDAGLPMLVSIEESRSTFSDVGARADDEHEDHQETLEIEQCRLLPRPNHS